jgi:hypothetical protein
VNDDLTFAATSGRLVPDLSDTDRENLQAAIGELFHHQAILRDLPGDRELYDWARGHLDWVREICALIGFEVFLNEDDQLIHALPGNRITLRRLKTEWTLVVLSLWYDYDVRLRSEGAPVIFSVEEFNESLKTKLGERQPSHSSLKEILAFFATRKLLRMEYSEEFYRSKIEVLPTIRFVLPFGELEKAAQAMDDLMNTGTREGEDNG